MGKTILAATLLTLIALGAPRPAAADFSLFTSRPGFSLFAGPPVVYGPPVAVAPPLYAPPVVVEPPYYVPAYGKHYWKHWKKHRGWHRRHWDDDDWDDD